MSGPITDPALIAQLETSQASINKNAPAAGGGGAPGAAILNSTKDEWNSRLARIKQARGTTDRLEQLYNAQLKGFGLGSVAEYFPSQAHSQFDATAAQLRKDIKPLNKVKGDPLSDKDTNIDLNGLPGRMNNDSYNEEAFGSLRRQLANMEAESYRLSGLTPPKKRLAGSRSKVITINLDGN